jgi:hypothetical protein
MQLLPWRFTQWKEDEMLKFLIPLVVIAVPAIAGQRATFGSCLAAVEIAQLHNNEWQETEFTPEECAVIAGKAIDSGYVLINPKSSTDEIDRAIRNLNGTAPPPESTLSDAPAIELKSRR